MVFVEHLLRASHAVPTPMPARKPPAKAAATKASEEGITKEQAYRRRQLERRDTESQVQREITNRFPLLSHVDTDVRQIAGQPLRQTLIEDKRSAKLEGRKLGSSYWMGMQDKWLAELSPGAKLVVKDKSEAIDSRLVQALVQAKTPNGRATLPGCPALGASIGTMLSNV